MNDGEKLVAQKYTELGYKIIRKGMPDFLLIKDGAISFIEVKHSTEDKLSKDQARVHSILKDEGFDVKVEVAREFKYDDVSIVLFQHEQREFSNLCNELGDHQKAADRIIAARFYWTNIKDIEQ